MKPGTGRVGYVNSKYGAKGLLWTKAEAREPLFGPPRVAVPYGTFLRRSHRLGILPPPVGSLCLPIGTAFQLHTAMSEYWKSTPKYWCKYCSEYVKDTKFERQKHEATGRHQGGIQRQLKGIHREQANQARQQQRAKDEVARLNGIVPSSSSPSTAAGTLGAGTQPTFAKTEERKATLQDRKKQWEQLASMGIAVPDERGGRAAATGEWSVVSEQIVGEVGDDGVVREVALNKGVRKRKLDEEEEERIQAGETITKKKGWGHTYKTFPGKGGATDEDVEALFNMKPAIKTEDHGEVKEEVKEEDGVKEEGIPSSLLDIPTAEEEAAGSVKKEDDRPAPAVVFKKRKKIAKA